MITPNLLYKEKIELMFSDSNHSYSIGNEKVPSVTKILGTISKPALVPWAANVTSQFLSARIMPGVPYDELQLHSWFEEARKAHTQRKTDAGNIGTLVHNWIEKYIKGENPDMPLNEDLAKSVNKFLKWREEHDVKFLLSEQVVYSKEHNYCGTFDMAVKLDGELCLLDLKTSSGIWDEYWLQLFAYWIARKEEFPEEEYKNVAVLRIGKERGEFEFAKKEIKENMYLKDGFLSALVLSKTLERMKI